MLRPGYRAPKPGPSATGIKERSILRQSMFLRVLAACFIVSYPFFIPPFVSRSAGIGAVSKTSTTKTWISCLNDIVRTAICSIGGLVCIARSLVFGLIQHRFRHRSTRIWDHSRLSDRRESIFRGKSMTCGSHQLKTDTFCLPL